MVTFSKFALHKRNFKIYILNFFGSVLHYKTLFIIKSNLRLQSCLANESLLFSNVNISEYAKHPDIDENVAVIVCGRETKFQCHFSNHYEDIKHCLGNIVIIWLHLFNDIQ